MRVPRRLQALSVAVSLAAASFGVPAGALAQSAGDEQYQDPLAGETQTQPEPAPSVEPQAPDVDAVPQLSPNAGGTGSGTTTPPAATAPTAPTQALPSTLPNTGADGRVLAAIGLGLLLCGIGLRLRTARERF